MVTKGRFLRESRPRRLGTSAWRHAVGVSSCTTGLMLAYKALGLTGEVIVPSFTFMASVSSLVWAGLRPVFVEVVDPNAANIDPGSHRKRQSPSKHERHRRASTTSAYPAEIEDLERIAKSTGLKLIFDAAHGFGMPYRGTPVGQQGDAQVFSLSPTKLLIAGEGGIVSTNDARSPRNPHRARVRQLRQLRQRLRRHQRAHAGGQRDSSACTACASSEQRGRADGTGRRPLPRAARRAAGARLARRVPSGYRELVQGLLDHRRSGGVRASIAQMLGKALAAEQHRHAQVLRSARPPAHRVSRVLRRAAAAAARSCSPAQPEPADVVGDGRRRREGHLRSGGSHPRHTPSGSPKGGDASERPTPRLSRPRLRAATR